MEPEFDKDILWGGEGVQKGMVRILIFYFMIKIDESKNIF
jgi:hypothetical protein